MTQFQRHEIAQWLKQIKVDVPLEDKTEQYVELFNDPYDDQAKTLRGPDVVRDIAEMIRYRHDEPTCQLFSGFVGTGKTTELHILKRHLERDNFTVLYVDFADYHDLNHALDIVTFSVLVAGAFGEATQKLLNTQDDKLNYWQRFKKFLVETNVEVSEINLKSPLFEVKSTLRNGSAEGWQKVRQQLSGSAGSIKQQARNFINDCQSQIRKATPNSAGIVFILDSMERLRGNLYDFEEVMQSVVQTFSDHGDFFKLPNCHSVFTVPPYVGFFGETLGDQFDERGQKPLPAIKIWDKDTQTKHQEGIDAIIRVLRKRIPDLDRIFGATHQALLEDLAFSSAGHLKTALSFLKKVIFDLGRNDTSRLPKIIERVKQDFSQDANNSVRPEDVSALYHLCQTYSLDKLDEHEIYRVSRFIDSRYVLCYQNGEGWFQVHPLLEPHIRRRAKDMGLVDEQANQRQASS